MFCTAAGMPVRVKMNQCIGKAVANGATGKIFHIDWRSDTQFERKTDGVWVASTAPSNVFVDIRDQHSQSRFPGNPAAWPASVMPVLQTRAKFSLASDSISIKGYPVVPAFGTTVHGVQGDTRDKIVVTDLRPPHFHRIDRHTRYVALSRVRTRAGLYWAGRPSITMTSCISAQMKKGSRRISAYTTLRQQLQQERLRVVTN